MSRPDQCFACGRKLHEGMERIVDTRDAQTVYVGPECYRKIKAAGEIGYQPPLGGPKLYLFYAWSADRTSETTGEK